MGAYQSYLDYRAARLKKAEEKARREAEEYQKRYNEHLRQLGVSEETIQQAHNLSDGLGPPRPPFPR